MKEPADQLVGHPASPPIALVDDVYYPMDDLMGTPPLDSQVATVVANWDSDWNPNSEQWFRQLPFCLGFRAIRSANHPFRVMALANHPPKR